MVEVIERQHDADDNHDRPNEIAIESAGDAGAGITTGDSGRGHGKRQRPVDQSCLDEDGDGDSIDGAVQEGLEAIHGMDVGEAHERQAAEHQDADAGAKIAAIDGDQ